MILLYLLATISLVLELVSVTQGFIYTPSGPERLMFFADLQRPLGVANEFIYIVMLCISDLVLVWRCWIVWNKNWLVIVLPVLMIVGQVVTGCVAVGEYLTPNTPNVYAIRPWASSMYAASLVTNVILSSTIGGRLWWSMRSSSKLVAGARHGIRDALRLVIESGLAITSAKIIEFTLFQIAFINGNENQAIFVMLGAMPQIFGIIPTLILLSIQTGITPVDGYGSNTSSGSSPFLGATKPRTPVLPNKVYGRKGGDMPFVSVETAIYKDSEDNDLELADRQEAGSSNV